MADTCAPALRIEGLVKRFGRTQALQGIDLVLDRPGVYGFLGPNGAGKTTTFKLTGGLLRPTAGRILIQGLNVRADSAAASRRIGILFDSPAFYPYLSGADNLEVFARWNGAVHAERIPVLLETVGLGGDAHRKVGGYSWGMQRRLGIAAALLGDPELLLLDEPTNGLDPSGIADVRRLLPHLAWQEGKTVLLSSHRMEEVAQVCDHVTIIHRGRIVGSGTPAQLAQADPVIEIECDDARRALALLGAGEGAAHVEPTEVAQVEQTDAAAVERTAAAQVQQTDAAAVQRTAAAQVERTGAGRLRLRLAGMTAAEVNRMLIENGIEVFSVVERRESLEEVFFRLTGAKNDAQ